MSEPIVPITSLAQLAALQGVNIQRAAIQAGLSPTLIERVDNGRQAFPMSKARVFAEVLGVSVAAVLVAARVLLDDVGSSMPVSLVAQPLPPNPIYGETFPTNLVNGTRERPAATPIQSLVIWSVGQGVGDVGGVGAFGRINQNMATALSPIATTSVQSPISLARSSDTLFTVGTMPSGGGPYLAAVARNGALLFERVIDTIDAPYAIEYEPTTMCIYVSIGSTVVRFDVTTGAQVADVELTYLGNVYQAFGIYAANGKLYVAGARAIGGADADGRLFEIDPLTMSIVRVSSRDSMHFARDVTFDGTDFYVVSRAGLGAGLYSVSSSLFVTTPVPLPGIEQLFDPRWVIRAFDHLFVSEVDAFDTPKLVKIKPSVDVTFLEFPGRLPLGKPDVDQWLLLLWVPNPSAGTVTMVEPMTMNTLVAVDVGGTPQAVRVM